MLRGAGRPAAKPFVGSEKVSGRRQGSAEGSSLLALAKHAAGQAGYFEEASGIGRLIAEKLECVAVKTLAAWLGNDVDHSASRLLELRGSKRCLDTKLFHRFHQRHDSNTVDVDIGVVSAIQDVGVLVGSRAIHGCVEGYGPSIPLQVVHDVVSESSQLSRNRAWPQRDQRNDVAAE